MADIKSDAAKAPVDPKAAAPKPLVAPVSTVNPPIPPPPTPPAVSRAFPASPPAPASPTTGATPVPVPPKVPVRPLTTEDKFVLKDTNNDGIPDIILIVPPDKDAAAKAAEAAKFAEFHKAIADARLAAAQANTGKPAADVAAAENLAEAKVRVSWKGPVPPPTQAEKDKEAAAKAAAADAAKVQAELEKMAIKAAPPVV